MRKSSVFLLSAVVGLALVIPTQEAAAQQTRGNSDGAVTYHERSPYSANATCNGVRITIDGWIEVKVLNTTSASGNLNYAVIVNGKGAGVDASGNMYQWLLNRVQHKHDSAMSSQAVDVINSRARLIGQGDVPNYDYVLQTHYTINANGEATASFHNLDATCRF